ncbi:MAG TPA: hypothetical protein VH351_10800 [Bryobacteraceae bacterium]|jgi:hypothetical protein|nr:hypothetical protein [Bryobacteraceae bacterium]
MASLKVIDETENKMDFATDHVPRIGECIKMRYGIGKSAPVEDHYFRVKDVMYLLDDSKDKAAVLVEEAETPPQWF